MTHRFLPLALAFVTLLMACEKEPVDPPEKLDEVTKASPPAEVPEPSTEIAPSPEALVAVTGDFGTTGQLPTQEGEPRVVDVPEEVAQTMSEEAAERFTAIALRRGLDGVTVELGGDGPNGLRMVVKHGDDKATVHVPPAQHPAEAVTNLDHTFERALNELR